MPKFKILSILFAGAALSACSTASTTPTTPVIPAGAIGNATANADGSYTITANSTTYELGSGTLVASSNTRRFFGFLPNARARGFGNADVTAIGGMLADGTAFSGISGTAATSIPTTGTATYSARYTIIYPTASGLPVIGGLDGATTVTLNTATGALSTSSPYLSVSATVSGVTFSGTATCNYPSNGCAATVPMEGGFYGTNGIAMVYAGTGLAGALYGTQNP